MNYWLLIGFLYPIIGAIAVRIIRHGQRRKNYPAWMLILHDSLIFCMWPVLAAMAVVAATIIVPLYALGWMIEGRAWRIKIEK